MKDLVSLAFFAKIFNLNEEDLEWAIAYTPQAEQQIAAAIIVKNKKFYVDVEAGKLKHHYKRGDKKVTLSPAKLNKKGNRYDLCHKTADCELHLEFTATDIKNLYADRCDVSNL